MKTSSFKELQFNSEQEFENWLGETTFKKIFFRDNGQDLMKIHVAQSGEIIYCNMQSSIWNGKFVNMAKLEKGLPIQFWDDTKSDWDTMAFVIAVVR